MKTLFIKLYIISSLILLFNCHATAQSRKGDTNASQLMDKLWFGGGVGLGISSSTFNLSLSPMVGYKLTPAWSAGVRIPFDYNYARLLNTNGSVITYSNVDWGLGAFTRYKLFRGVFAHTEFNHLWLKEPVASTIGGYLIDPENPDRLLLESRQGNEWNLGLGYSSGNRIGYEISLLYNLLQEENSPAIPWTIRVGFNYNF